MTDFPVQAVWVWRFTKTPYKATYGRLQGTTYSKDFLQPIGECARVLDAVLARAPRAVVDLQWQWPGGSRDGRFFEAADYDDNGRLDLRWETDRAPDPWKLYPEDDTSSIKTFLGDSTRRTEAEADQEYEEFRNRQLDLWLVVVKLFDEMDVLHVRAYLGNPPPELAHTTTEQLPENVRAAMARVPAKGGCAAVLVTTPLDGDSREREWVLFDPSRIHDAWSVVSMDSAGFRSRPQRDRRETRRAGKPRRSFGAGIGRRT